MRVSREWNDLNNRKRAGFAHDAALSGANKPGSLAMFCCACPQPGINMPVNWQDLDNTWRFQRVYAMDGLFKADHLRIKTPHEVYLSDGLLFMVLYSLFEKHLATATSQQEVNIFTLLEVHGLTLISSHRGPHAATIRQ